MPVLLAIFSSALYGTGDFFGGLASRGASPRRVTLWAQVISLIPLAIALALWGPVTVGIADVGWGLVGGVAGGFGLVRFYGALATGPMSPVAAVTGVVGATVPAAGGVLLGDRLALLTGIGLAVGVASIGLVSLTGGHALRGAHARVLLDAATAGLGFGLFFVCFGQVAPEAGMWPMVSARVGSISVLVAIGMAARDLGSIPSSTVRSTAIAGVFDIVANGTLLWAITRGPTSVLGVLSSLYPAATVLLARLVLRERLARPQIAGLLAAGVAVSLVAVGHG